MTETLILSNSPHIHSKVSGRRLMLDVILALLPAAAAAVILFGAKAGAILAVCTAAAVLAEVLFNLCCGKKQTIGDLSAVVTGLLLGLNLSTNVPLWQCAAGSVFAIIVVKCLFGGIGKNFANPAISGRVFMLLVFSSVAGGAAPKAVDLVSSATPLEMLANGSELPSLGSMLLGLRGGTIGETCILALAAGYAWLVGRKVIKWYVPAAFIGTVFVLFLVSAGDFMFAFYEILSGGLFLGAIFMATDYVTTPINSCGRVIFAVGCGIITFVIRSWFAYPEGVSFSILIMNLLSPYIERLTAGKPLGGA